MFFRARRALNRAWFEFNVRELRNTAALPCSETPITIVSMVCHGEVSMYLLALKSFVRHLGVIPRVLVLNDGSLTLADKQTLSKHVDGIAIREISEISTGLCPKGGCWERLLLISDLVQESYVVQLDSDTLTSAAVPEVLSCIEENRCFTLLGDRSHPSVRTMLEAWEDLKTNTSTQPQAVCERNFSQLKESRNLKYLRGNAGFVGFAKGSFKRDRVVYFSELMRSISEGTWNRWGSEQLTSNLLIANSTDPLPLPFPKYCSFWAHPDVDYRASSFIHFIGPYRFAQGLYRKSAKVALRALQSSC